MTTFTSRETIRDAVYTLFSGYAPATFKAVYNNWPDVGQAKGQSPILMITSSGTGQGMANLNTNPTEFRLMLTVLVKTHDDSDSSFTRATAMDKIDTLDALVRQVIRDAISGLNPNWDNIAFEGGLTTVENIIFEGLPYMVEAHPIRVYLRNGAI